jgi:hypothetical protein
LFYTKEGHDGGVVPEIDEQIIEAFLSLLETALLERLHRNASYLEFVMNTCSDPSFNFRILESAPRLFSLLKAKCENEEFAKNLLGDSELNQRVLLKKPTDRLRAAYFESVEIAMKHVNAGHLRPFAEFLVEKSATLQTTSENGSKFPSDFFSLFLTLFDLDPTISLPNLMDTFVRILQETMKSADWTSLDLSVLFRILRKIVQRDVTLSSMLNSLTTSEIIVPCLSSTENFYEFCELLDVLMNRCVAVKSLLPVIQWELPPKILARVFKLTMEHHPASSGYFVNCLEHKQDPFLIEFVEEFSMIKGLQRIMKSFIAVDWTPVLLLRQSSAVRRSAVKLIRSFHLDDLCYQALFEHLMRHLERLEELTFEMISSQGSKDGVPTEEFFSLLTWIIAGGKLNALAIESWGKFVNLMEKLHSKDAKKCEKHVLKCVLSFVTFDKASSSFVREAVPYPSLSRPMSDLSFSDQDKAESCELVSKFLPLIPPGRVAEFCESPLFQNILGVCFTPDSSDFDRMLTDFIIDNHHLMKKDLLAKLVYSESNLKKQSSATYLRLCRKLMKLAKIGFVDFGKQRSRVWQMVNRDGPVHREGLKTLAVYNSGQKKDETALFWHKADVRSVFELEESEAWRFLASVAEVSTNLAMELWEKCNHILPYLGTTPAQKDYARFLVAVYRGARQSQSVQVAQIATALCAEFESVAGNLTSPVVVPVFVAFWRELSTDGKFVEHLDQYLTSSQLLQDYNVSTIEPIGISQFSKCHQWAENLKRLVVQEYRRCIKLPIAEIRHAFGNTAKLIAPALAFLMFLWKSAGVPRIPFKLNVPDIEMFAQMDSRNWAEIRELFSS